MGNRYMIILMAVLVFAGMALAQTKTTVTVGGSWWNSKYDWIATDDNDDLENIEIGNGNFIGPYLSLNHGKVNFGASMLLGSLDVKDMEGLELKRTDLNFTLGYRIVSGSALSMNLFGGVKYVKLSTVGTWTIPGYDYGYEDFELEIDESVSGPMFGGGMSLVIPFGTSNLYGYGSLAYLTGTLTQEDNTTGESAENENATNLVSLNAGLGYRFPGGFGISGGYRGDFFGSDEADYVDRLSGFALTASYTF